MSGYSELEYYSGKGNLPEHLLRGASSREDPTSNGFYVGREAEKRFFEICSRYYELGKFPDQMTGFRPATQKEESRRMDALIFTTERKIRIPIQIKSSEMGRQRFLKRNRRKPHLPCIVVAPYMQDEDILRFLLAELEFVWDFLTRLRDHRATRKVFLAA